MWRANPKQSKKIIIRQIAFDEYGENPAFKDTVHIAEIYPCSDLITRQAIGIVKEDAYTVLLERAIITADTVVIIDDMVFKIPSYAMYEPIQLIIACTQLSSNAYMKSIGG